MQSPTTIWARLGPRCSSTALHVQQPKSAWARLLPCSCSALYVQRSTCSCTRLLGERPSIASAGLGSICSRAGIGRQMGGRLERCTTISAGLGSPSSCIARGLRRCGLSRRRPAGCRMKAGCLRSLRTPHRRLRRAGGFASQQPANATPQCLIRSGSCARSSNSRKIIMTRTIEQRIGVALLEEHTGDCLCSTHETRSTRRRFYSVRARAFIAEARPGASFYSGQPGVCGYARFSAHDSLGFFASKSTVNGIVDALKQTSPD